MHGFKWPIKCTRTRIRPFMVRPYTPDIRRTRYHPKWFPRGEGAIFSVVWVTRVVDRPLVIVVTLGNVVHGHPPAERNDQLIAPIRGLAVADDCHRPSTAGACTINRPLITMHD